jgi:L-aminopeptidase/D-esterase-like protein
LKPALTLAANVALDRLAVTPGDSFLVVSNPDLVGIAAELAEAARARTRNVRIQEFRPTSRDGQEPPAAVATAMLAATAIAIVTRFSLSHTEARRAATRTVHGLPRCPA